MLLLWQPKHDECLREQAALTRTASQIADAINQRFGTELSRNAVIARASRTKIQLRVPNGVWNQTRQRKIRRSAEGAARECCEHDPQRLLPVNVPLIVEAPEPARMVRFLDVKEGLCRSLIDVTVPVDELMVCGVPVAHEATSWCAFHEQRYHQVEEATGAASRTTR